MYLSNAADTTFQGFTGDNHLLSGLNGAAIQALTANTLAKDGMENVEELKFLFSLGSAISSGEGIFDALAFRGSVTALKKAAVAPAVSAFVTSAWFALKYPLIGPIVSFFPSFFGPPGWLVQGSVLVAMAPVKALAKGAKAKYDRSKQVGLMTIAIPAMYAVALSDGAVSVEEMRFLHDLIRQVPPESDYDPSRVLGRLVGKSCKQIKVGIAQMLKYGREGKGAGQKPGKAARAIFEEDGEVPRIKLNNDQFETLLRYGVLIALADGRYQGDERAVLRSFVKAQNFDVTKFTELSRAVESEHMRAQHLSEAAIRAMSYVARSDQLQDDERQLLDVMLMSQVVAESQRRRIGKKIQAQFGDDLLFSKPQLCAKKPLHPAKTIFGKLKPWDTPDAHGGDLDLVLTECVGFVTTLEKIREQALPLHHARLIKVGERYGFSKNEVFKRIEKVRKAQNKTEETALRVAEVTKKSRCPNCKAAGHMRLVERYFLTRNEYECTQCRIRTLLCRIPGCKQMVLRGDFYTNELCHEHGPL